MGGYSRHPNYFCEVSTWWSFYLFSVSATGNWLNWTIWGPLFLTGLFVPPGASLDVTEKLSLAKYPHYAEYQQRVSRFIPWFPSSKRERRVVDHELSICNASRSKRQTLGMIDVSTT